MCALKRPFQASSMKSLMRSIRTAEVEPLPPHCGTGLADLVRRLLVHNEQERPDTREILAIDYARDGLARYCDAVRRSLQIHPSVKKHIAAEAEGMVCTSSADIEHQGPVKKLGGTFGKTWKERHLSISGGEFVIYEDPTRTGRGSALPLDRIQAVSRVEPKHAGKSHVFEVSLRKGKPSRFQAPSEGDQDVWLAKLRLVIKLCEVQQRPRSS
eukprot:Rhum_TRINITY_DN15211_c22_g1::Rhum_TRINITY_DN15211_c22_g1_i1::g.145006::m.145006